MLVGKIHKDVDDERDLGADEISDHILLLFSCHISNQAHVVCVMFQPNRVVVMRRSVILDDLVQAVFVKKWIQRFSMCVCIDIVMCMYEGKCVRVSMCVMFRHIHSPVYLDSLFCVLHAGGNMQIWSR